MIIHISPYNINYKDAIAKEQPNLSFEKKDYQVEKKTEDKKFIASIAGAFCIGAFLEYLVNKFCDYQSSKTKIDLGPNVSEETIKQIRELTMDGLGKSIKATAK